ncbi:MAG: hypothetical protein SOZ53_06765, partial [Candidatus Onthovivens sp.]|nr:hypothetical protein [Candidatus Onthovivens sp.]
MTTVKIDKRKSYKICLDTETTLAENNEQVIFDLGFCVFTQDGTIYEKFSFVIDEVFSNYELMKKAFYFSKFPIYLEGLNTGKFQKVPWKYALLKLMEMIEKYNVKEICAYNLKFDLGAINKTNQYIRGREFKLFDNLKHTCIWGQTCEVVFQQKSFKAFAEKHGLISDSGKFYKTSAEVAYKYLINNPDFEEEHTGLEDSLIEVQIYVRNKRQKKKMSGGIINQPFRKVAI